MRRKYLSLLLAAAIALTQIAGTGLTVQASEVSEGIGQEAGKASGEMRDDVSEEIGQEPEAGTSEGAGQPGEIQPPAERTEQPLEGTRPPEEIQPSAETEWGVYSPVFNLTDEYRLLSGSNLWISRTGSGYWISEDGLRKELEITEVVSANTEIVSIEKNEEIDGWQLIAKGLGKTTVTVTSTALPDVSGDNASAMQPVKKEISVIVSDTAYALQVEGAPQNVNPGADVSMTAKVSAWGLNGTVTDISDVVVNWKADSEYEGFLKTSGTGNGFQIHVPEGDNTSYRIQVTTEARRGEEVVASQVSSIVVTNLYYQLDTGAAEELEEMWPGETKTITPVLYRYETGKEPVPEPTAKFQFTYNGENIEIRKDEVLVEQDVPQDNGSFTLKRIQNGDDLIKISASIRSDVPKVYGTVHLRWKNYKDIAILGGENDFDAHLFVDDNDPEENSTELALTLDTAKLSRSFFADSSIHTCLFRSLLLRFVSVP